MIFYTAPNSVASSLSKKEKNRLKIGSKFTALLGDVAALTGIPAIL